LRAPVQDLSDVAEAGRQFGEIYRYILEHPSDTTDANSFLLSQLLSYFGHGGTFDYQRRGNIFAGYTQFRQFRDISNFNVGLFCQQAGLTLADALKFAGLYASHFSSNAHIEQPSGLDPITEEFIREGFAAGQRGLFDQAR
jgi:hypothetical protein